MFMKICVIDDSKRVLSWNHRKLRMDCSCPAVCRFWPRYQIKIPWAESLAILAFMLKDDYCEQMPQCVTVLLVSVLFVCVLVLLYATTTCVAQCAWNGGYVCATVEHSLILCMCVCQLSCVRVCVCVCVGYSVRKTSWPRSAFQKSTNGQIVISRPICPLVGFDLSK